MYIVVDVINKGWVGIILLILFFEFDQALIPQICLRAGVVNSYDQKHSYALILVC